MNKKSFTIFLIKQKLQSFLISEKNYLNTQRNALHNLQILKSIDQKSSTITLV